MWTGFNKHPPLGVNATPVLSKGYISYLPVRFQQAPTLGGECYVKEYRQQRAQSNSVSTSTHPWG